MSQISMESDQKYSIDHAGAVPAGYGESNSPWIDSQQPVYHSPHQQSPAHEFSGFSFSPMPLEPTYHGMPPPRTTHQQLQPLIMPQWPSMLTSQSGYAQPVFPTTMMPMAPPMATPVSAGSAGNTGTSRPASTPRKTLTDSDRRRMCEYAESHPNTKQTEIGQMFGVERSTVSKVLRQKEKYLHREEGSQSPARKSKGKFPDIDRALSNWIRNQRRQGLPLTDAAIKEKARFFATTVGGPEAHQKANSNSWLEKFKQKNDILYRSRKNSRDISPGTSNPASGAQTPGDIPVSPKSPTEVNDKESSDDAFAHGHRPFHSLSNPALSSMFEGSKASLSEDPSGAHSPFYTPDSMNDSNHFVPIQPRDGSMGNGGFQRPRSQTFPMIGIEPFSPPSSGSLTPKYLNASAIDDSIEMPTSIGGVDSASSVATSIAPSMLTSPDGSAISSAASPPLPSTVAPSTMAMSTKSGVQSHSSPVTPCSTVSSPTTPSHEDARKALEIVMTFFQRQPSGFVEPQEYMSMGKLMEKLKLHSRRPSAEGVYGLGLSRPTLNRPGTGDLASIPEGGM